MSSHKCILQRIIITCHRTYCFHRIPTLTSCASCHYAVPPFCISLLVLLHSYLATPQRACEGPADPTRPQEHWASTARHSGADSPQTSRQIHRPQTSGRPIDQPAAARRGRQTEGHGDCAQRDLAPLPADWCTVQRGADTSTRRRGRPLAPRRPRLHPAHPAPSPADTRCRQYRVLPLSLMCP